MTWFNKVFKYSNTFLGQQRLAIILACTVILSLSKGSSLVYEYISFNHDSRVQLGAMADIIAAEISAALAFDDKTAIQKSLQSLEADPTITQLFVLNAQGEVAAYYIRGNRGHTPAEIERRLESLRDDMHNTFFDLSPEVIRPIIHDDVKLGTILLQFDSKVFQNKLLASLGIGTVIFLLSLIGSYMLARGLAQILNKPLLALATTMEEVARTKNFKLRAEKSNVIELSNLAEGLNDMLDEISNRDDALLERQELLSISTDELTSVNARLRAETNIKQDAIETLRRSANGILRALGQPEITDDQAGLGTLSNLMETLVSQRQAIDEELRQQKRALDHHAIVSITDANGTIIYANEKFCEISGYSENELLGQAHRIVNSGIHRREFFAELWRTITAGEVWHGEVCNRKKSGELYWVNATIVPILDENSVPRNYIAIRTDITANKRMTEDLRIAAIELNKAKEAAEAGLLVKSAFLANMSHEIRTPMNAVIGFAEVALQDPALSSETRKHVKMILSSAKELLSIINDILDISKLESAKFTLETACFNLPNVLSAAMRTLEHRAAAKGLNLSLEYAATLPIRLLGDPYRLRQVILNLLGNAVKFTTKGEIVLSVQHGNEPDMLLFSIKDTGIGMTPEQIAKIFEPFSQADASTTRHYGGTGLGTTISKQIVELMQGKIWVESEISKGSVFYFTAFFPEATTTDGCLYEEDDSIEENYISPRLFRILLAE
ncbi:MAG: ATP-binding protein, partial [Deltaproteobacteria bacterium]